MPHQPSTRNRSRLSFWPLAGLLAATVAAAIDLTGTYVTQLEVFSTPCTLTFTQTGTAITIAGPCNAATGTYTFELTGTVDPMTGAFTASGTLGNLCETPGSVTMTGTGDGETFSGVAICGTLSTNVIGTKCNNGVLDAGEDCEDGNTEAGDCCSPTCRFDPAGSACTPDANACTLDECDGAGQCTHPPDPSASGMPCASDFDVCTDDLCDAAGQCTHPANTAPCDDLNPCTTPDTCAGGACTGGQPVPACVGSIDLTGDWVLGPTAAGGADFAGPVRHFAQSGVVLRSNVPGGTVGDGWVNSATGEFESRTPFTYLTAFCTEVVDATATADGQSFTGQRTLYCGLDGNFGPYGVTGQRCPDAGAGCPSSCMPAGGFCTVADEGARLVIRAKGAQLPSEWRWTHSAIPVGFGDPTAGTDYRLCLETPAGGWAEVAPHGADWRATRRGFRYAAHSGVIRRLTLKSKASEISFAASLVAGPTPAPPLTTPVRVLLLRDGPSPVCFEADFSNPTVNAAGKFRATE